MSKPKASTAPPGQVNADVVESARRVLDIDGKWERKTTERLTTPARRSRVGLIAPPLPLAAALVRTSQSGVRKKPKMSHKMPMLDLSSITLT